MSDVFQRGSVDEEASRFGRTEFEGAGQAEAARADEVGAESTAVPAPAELRCHKNSEMLQRQEGDES